jgi:Tol biopolymer transport system component
VYSPLDKKSTQVVRFGAEPQFSPDGRWIAYISIPMRQILVQPFPGPGAHIQISNVTGSSQPRWSRDGRKIFYVQPDRKLMVVAFDPAKNSASPPQAFAQTRITVTTFGWFQYDVSPDGRLLATNWTAELKIQ